MTVLSPHASEETKFNGKIGQLKASKPLIQELIPGLKRKNDKEYCGPCPHCKDGEDRFIVFTETQTYWCRQCNTKGDILNYIELTTGKNIKEQLAEAGRLEKPAGKTGRGSKQQFIWKQSKPGDSPAYRYLSATKGASPIFSPARLSAGTPSSLKTAGSRSTALSCAFLSMATVPKTRKACISSTPQQIRRAKPASKPATPKKGR